jgi:hypothetical protein
LTKYNLSSTEKKAEGNAEKLVNNPKLLDKILDLFFLYCYNHLVVGMIIFWRFFFLIYSGYRLSKKKERTQI